MQSLQAFSLCCEQSAQVQKQLMKKKRKKKLIEWFKI